MGATTATTAAGRAWGSWCLIAFCLLASAPGILSAVESPAAPQGEVAAWGAATSADTCRAYQGFVARFPDGKLSALAAKRAAASCAASAPEAVPAVTSAEAVSETAVDGDRAAWSAAAGNATCSAFQRYLKAYPQGSHAPTARDRLAACVKPPPVRSKPSEAPLTAAASPAAAAIGRPEVEAVVSRLIAVSNAADADGTAALYVGRPSYFGKNAVDRGFVRQDKRRFFARWPQVKYRVLGPLDVDTLGNGDACVRFRVAFAVADPARGKAISGEAENWLTIGREGGQAKIKSIGERVLSRQAR